MVKKVKIGSSIFNVNYVDGLKDGNDSLYGHIEYSDLIITVNNKHHKRQQEKTILHEMVHAMAEENQINWNEKKIIVITNILMSLIIDNKQFFKDVLDGS